MRALAKLLAPITTILLLPYALWVYGGHLADRWGQRNRVSFPPKQ